MKPATLFCDSAAGAPRAFGTWVVLSALSDEGLVSQAALGTEIHLEGATITHHIDRLERLGLVRRQTRPIAACAVSS